MRSAKIALAAGLTLIVIAIGLVLLHSPSSVARTNGTPGEEHRIAFTTHGATYCQAQELLPAGTSALRLSLSAFSGPRVRVAVSAGGHPLTGGEQESGWTSRVLTVPVRARSRAVPDATVCVSFSLHDEAVTVFGKPTSHTIAAHDGRRALRGRMWIEYLHSGGRSWASLAPTILSSMRFGRGGAGVLIVSLALVLLVAVAALTARLVLEELS